MKKYVVTKDNPYYPDIEYFDTLEDAQKQRNRWLKEMNEFKGKFRCLIIIAEIIEENPFNSYY